MRKNRLQIRKIECNNFKLSIDNTLLRDRIMHLIHRYPKINYDFDRDVHFDNFIDNQLVINLNDDDDEDDDDSSTSSV